MWALMFQLPTERCVSRTGAFLLFILVAALQRAGCALTAKDDLVVSLLSTESRAELLDAAAETWRQGLRTFVYVNSAGMAENMTRENKFPGVIFDWFPDGAQCAHACMHACVMCLVACMHDTAVSSCMHDPAVAVVASSKVISTAI